MGSCSGRSLKGIRVSGRMWAMVLAVAAGRAVALQPAAEPTAVNPPSAPVTPPLDPAPVATPPAPVAPAPTPAEPAVVEPTSSDISLEAFTAQSLQRVAMIDLRQQVVDLPRDYRIVYRLLREAERFAPRDLELAHKLGEAAWKMEDDEAVIETCKRIIALDPKDTSAMLRLITTRLNATQTLDQRLEGYERFLGPEGKSIDPAVRSRLAMDAGHLRRERGDDKGFVQLMKLAAQLDPTNKEAAQDAALYYAQRVGDPLGRMELIANLMYADPMDPTTQLWMARELGMQGAFVQADRFHTLGRSLIGRSGQQPDVKIYIESMVLAWQSRGPLEPVKMLTDYVIMNRYSAEAKVKQAEQELQVTTEMKRAKDIRLDPDMERVRVMAAMMEGVADDAELTKEFRRAEAQGLMQGNDVLDSAVGDFGITVSTLYDKLSDPKGLPPGLAIEDARAEVRRLYLEAQMLRAMTNLHMDQVEFDQEKIAELTPPAPEGETRAEDPEEITTRGWLTLRSDGPEKALEILLTQGDTVAAARYGIATCREMLGQKEQAIADYRLLAVSDPMGVLGAAARTKLTKLTGRVEDLTPQTAAARNFGFSVPPSVDAMVTDPGSYMSLTAEVSEGNVSALGPLRVRLKLKNISTLPLSMGGGLVIDTRFLLAPAMMVRNEPAQKFIQPEVVGLDRRLRLMGGETLEAELWGEAGETGWMAEASSSEYVRLRWRVLQGFQTGLAGVFEPGIGSISTMTGTVTRLPLPEALIPVTDLIAKIATDPDEKLPALVAASRSRLVGIGHLGPVTGPDREALAKAWAARYTKTGATGRMLILAALPHGGISPEMEVLDDEARKETDPRVGIAVVATVCRDVTDPFLKMAAASSDEGLREVAALQAARLADVEMTYSRNGPGVRGRLAGSLEPKGVTP